MKSASMLAVVAGVLSCVSAHNIHHQSLHGVVEKRNEAVDAAPKKCSCPKAPVEAPQEPAPAPVPAPAPEAVVVEEPVEEDDASGVPADVAQPAEETINDGYAPEPVSEPKPDCDSEAVPKPKAESEPVQLNVELPNEGSDETPEDASLEVPEEVPEDSSDSPEESSEEPEYTPDKTMEDAPADSPDQIPPTDSDVSPDETPKDETDDSDESPDETVEDESEYSDESLDETEDDSDDDSDDSPDETEDDSDDDSDDSPDETEDDSDEDSDDSPDETEDDSDDDSDDSPGSTSIQSNGKKWAMTYSPYTSSGECKDADAVAVDIQSIQASGFTTVRLYSTDCSGLENVGKACEATGLTLILGIFIDGDGIDGARREKDDLLDWGVWSLVSLVVVGNEAIFNQAVDASTLAAFITEVKEEFRAAGYDGPCTTTETTNVWLDYGAGLCDAIDVMGANIHPFFNPDVTPEDAGSFTAGQMELIADICPGKDVYNLESGWPHAGEPNGVATPGKDAQATALSGILDEVGDKTVFFSFEDDLWKDSGAFNVEQSFGCNKAFAE